MHDRIVHRTAAAHAKDGGGRGRVAIHERVASVRGGRARPPLTRRPLRPRVGVAFEFRTRDGIGRRRCRRFGVCCGRSGSGGGGVDVGSGGGGGGGGGRFLRPSA